MFYEACFMMYILQDCNGFYCDSGSQFLVQVFAEAKKCSHLRIGLNVFSDSQSLYGLYFKQDSHTSIGF